MQVERFSCIYCFQRRSRSVIKRRLRSLRAVFWFALCRRIDLGLESTGPRVSGFRFQIKLSCVCLQTMISETFLSIVGSAVAQTEDNYVKMATKACGTSRKRASAVH